MIIVITIVEVIALAGIIAAIDIARNNSKYGEQ